MNAFIFPGKSIPIHCIVEAVVVIIEATSNNDSKDDSENNDHRLVNHNNNNNNINYNNNNNWGLLKTTTKKSNKSILSSEESSTTAAKLQEHDNDNDHETADNKEGDPVVNNETSSVQKQHEEDQLIKDEPHNDDEPDDLVNADSKADEVSNTPKQRIITEVDDFVIIPSHTLFHKLIPTVLSLLGYSKDAIRSAKGTISLRNWKPLALDQICEPEANSTVGDIFNDLTNHATLRILVTTRSKGGITTTAGGSSSEDLKEKLLRLLLRQSSSSSCSATGSISILGPSSVPYNDDDDQEDQENDDKEITPRNSSSWPKNVLEDDIAKRFDAWYATQAHQTINGLVHSLLQQQQSQSQEGLRDSKVESYGRQSMNKTTPSSNNNTARTGVDDELDKDEKLSLSKMSTDNNHVLFNGSKRQLIESHSRQHQYQRSASSSSSSPNNNRHTQSPSSEVIVNGHHHHHGHGHGSSQQLSQITKHLLPSTSSPSINAISSLERPKSSPSSSSHQDPLQHEPKQLLPPPSTPNFFLDECASEFLAAAAAAAAANSGQPFPTHHHQHLLQHSHHHHGLPPVSASSLSPAAAAAAANPNAHRHPVFHNFTSQKTRMRTSFDPEMELPKLQQWFAENPHPSRQQIQQYVRDLNLLDCRKDRKPLDVNNVIYWFKNARAAQKRNELRYNGVSYNSSSARAAQQHSGSTSSGLLSSSKSTSPSSTAATILSPFAINSYHQHQLYNSKQSPYNSEALFQSRLRHSSSSLYMGRSELEDDEEEEGDEADREDRRNRDDEGDHDEVEHSSLVRRHDSKRKSHYSLQEGKVEEDEDTEDDTKKRRRQHHERSRSPTPIGRQPNNNNAATIKAEYEEEMIAVDVELHESNVKKHSNSPSFDQPKDLTNNNKEKLDENSSEQGKSDRRRKRSEHILLSHLASKDVNHDASSDDEDHASNLSTTSPTASLSPRSLSPDHMSSSPNHLEHVPYLFGRRDGAPDFHHHHRLPPSLSPTHSTSPTTGNNPSAAVAAAAMLNRFHPFFEHPSFLAYHRHLNSFHFAAAAAAAAANNNNNFSPNHEPNSNPVTAESRNNNPSSNNVSPSSAYETAIAAMALGRGSSKSSAGPSNIFATGSSSSSSSRSNVPNIFHDFPHNLIPGRRPSPPSGVLSRNQSSNNNNHHQLYNRLFPSPPPPSSIPTTVPTSTDSVKLTSTSSSSVGKQMPASSAELISSIINSSSRHELIAAGLSPHAGRTNNGNNNDHQHSTSNNSNHLMSHHHHSQQYLHHHTQQLHAHHHHHGGVGRPGSSPTLVLSSTLDERRKRNRTFIDPVTEVPRLETWFSLNTHPSHNLILKYTDELNRMPYRLKFPRLEPKNVQFWFKNRRAKCKRLKMTM